MSSHIVYFLLFCVNYTSAFLLGSCLSPIYVALFCIWLQGLSGILFLGLVTGPFFFLCFFFSPFPYNPTGLMHCIVCVNFQSLLVFMAEFLQQSSGLKYFVLHMKVVIWMDFCDSWATYSRSKMFHLYYYLPICQQGDVGLPGPPGPPPSTGILEFMGFPKGKQGDQVCKYSQARNNSEFPPFLFC